MISRSSFSSGRGTSVVIVRGTGWQVTRCGFRSGPSVKASGASSSFANPRDDGADFTAATLVSSIFTEARAKGASFHVANLEGARLDRVDLGGATLDQASLYRTNLCKADLTRARFRGACLFEAKLLKVVEEDTDYSDAILTNALRQRA